MPESTALPLSLYVHMPWCVRKCPYCDFNSHALSAPLDESSYIQHLLADFAADYDGRELISIFIGGGTPSLFSGASIGKLLNGLAARARFAPKIEITLEANPGTAEQQKFREYRAAGVTRLSLGIQSFDNAQLRTLGRIHSAHEAHRAITTASAAGFSRINTDLMFALPGQSVLSALDDLKQAITHGAEHLSWYQLTIEPNTAFYTRPPAIPDEEQQNDIYEAGQQLLIQHGFRQYETSAWTRDQPSRHNLNYWQFGDYLGIGAGAHSKLTATDGKIFRTRKFRSPAVYQKAPAQGSNPYRDSQQKILEEDQPFEFMMNALRLKDGVPREYFAQRTQCQEGDIAEKWQRLLTLGLVNPSTQRYQTSERGFLLLNNVLDAFLPEV